MEVALEQLAGHGVLGLIAGLFILLYVKENKARIQDAKDNLALLMQVQKGTTDTVDKLRAIFDELRKGSR
jgi:hypothetical protein